MERWIFAGLLGLCATACLQDGPCFGGGVRVDGVCECPEGEEIVDRDHCGPASPVTAPDAGDGEADDGGGADADDGGEVDAGNGDADAAADAAADADAGQRSEERRFVQVSSGASYTCGLLEDGAVMCWGANAVNQLGTLDPGEDASRKAVVPVLVPGVLAKHVSTGHGGLTCAVEIEGSVVCWGAIMFGLESNEVLERPTSVASVSDATSVAVGFDEACAVLESGSVTCWRWNVVDGQPSQVTTTNASVTNAKHIAAARSTFCAVGEGGKVWCWSSGDVPEVRFESGVAMVAVGGKHVCVLDGSGAAQCIGSNAAGQLGNGTTMDSEEVPVDVEGFSQATWITAGYEHTCVVLAAGMVSCWGANSGRLGTTLSDEELQKKPVRVEDVVGATQVSAGTKHTCALLDSGEIWCWGDNSSGQLGDGTTIASITPVRVGG